MTKIPFITKALTYLLSGVVTRKAKPKKPEPCFDIEYMKSEICAWLDRVNVISWDINRGPNIIARDLDGSITYKPSREITLTITAEDREND